MVADRRKEMKESLLKKTQDSYDHRDDTGMFKDIFRDDIEGLLKWNCKPNQHLIDIIPYQAGDKDPTRKEGEWTYVLEVPVHGNVGVNQDSYLCLARYLRQPCPICEYREKLRNQDDYDEEEVKKLYPIRRVIYNIICYDDTKEEAKGIQVWLVAHFFMEKKLMAIAKMPARGSSGGGYVSFSDPEEGRSIQFERKGGKNNTEYLGHQFVAREGYTITNEILEQAFPLDQIIHIPTYEEVQKTFFVDTGGELESEEQQPETTQIEGEEPEPQPPSRRFRGSAPIPIEKEVEKPSTVRDKGVKTPAKTGPKCPHGGEFGKDCEELSECGKCEVWDDCSPLKDKIRADEAEKRKEKEPPLKPTGRSPLIGRRGPITGRR